MTETRPRLLVVDDDAGVARVIEHDAAQLGFLVECRDGGAPLPGLLAAARPDVAMLDMRTHERGLDALCAIRQTDPSCQIILMTSHATVDTAIDAMKSGASDYLAKPLDAARLHRALTAARASVARREATGETELERLTRMYSVVSQINQAISGMPTREVLFQKVCRILVEQGGFRVASIGWRVPDSPRLVTVSQCGDADGSMASIDMTVYDGLDGHETSPAAWREGGPHVCNDLSADADALPWRAELVRRGHRALAVFRLQTGNDDSGALNVFAGEAGRFKDKEIALLTDATAAISFALDNIERDAQRRQAEGIARSEKLISDTMIESLPCIVYFYDQQGRFLRWNRNFVTVSGYSAEEIAQMHPLDFFSGDDKRRVQERIAEVFESGQSAIEASFVSKSGRAIPYFFTGRRVIVDGAARLVGVGIDITERRQAGDQLAESERKYRELVEHANSIILRWNAEGRITFLNEYGQRFFGYPAEEVLGRHVIGTVVPALESSGRDLERLMERIRADPTAFERNVNENMRRNGERVWIAWTNRLGRDAQGEVADILSVGTDITEQKRAEGALRASEGRYRTLFEYAPDGIVIADRESHYIDANASMCRMLGYTWDELIGQHASDFVAEADADIKSALRAITDTSQHHREWRFHRKDGSVFPAEVIATVMPDGNLLGMIRDVSERNEALEALRTAEERMRFALQNAEVGIWDMDYATGAVRWSETLESQYGLPPRTFDGTFEAFLERIHSDDRASVLDAFEKAMTSGGDFSILNRAKRSDGSVRWLSGTGRILLGDHGEPVRSVGISLDVTERRTLEAQYLQAQKMEAIGQLAGGVAHDFNNLLTAILGYCELLLTDLDPADPRYADVGEIKKAGTRAAGLTRQLLAFSRKQIIEPTRLDLNVVVTEMREMLGRLIGEDVAVVLRLGRDLAAVQADRGQVEQIVMNLAVNARDAMPTGGTLTIETANVDLDDRHATLHFSVKPGPFVALTVSDTGTGMTADAQAHLFEPFYTTKDIGKGTGLGLATIHGIVTRSGGSAVVNSEIGKGTSFKVYLPKADTGALVAAPPVVSRFRAGGETVLVVEDVEELRELTARLLERQGYKVLVASNADEALQVFDQHSPIDVILTDVVMPGASGPELTRQLVNRRPMLKVIYMSGYSEDAIVHHGVLKQGIAFLHKPFSSQTLGRKIREVLEH